MILYDLPKDFLLGTGSSCYQVEGSVDADGKTPNIWDMASTSYPERFKATTEPTSAFYKYFREDVAEMKAQGLTTFRLSISWTRILPTLEGDVNPLGVKFYNELIDLLLGNGIEPFVDLFHWDLPMYLYNIGGFLNRDIVGHFTRYAKVCFESFGDRVKLWSTMNEPSVFCVSPYRAKSTWPPFGANGTDMKAALLASHIALLCHFSAVKLYKRMGLGGKIGAVIAFVPIYPKDPAGKDRLAAVYQTERVSGWWLDPMFFGRYPEQLLNDSPEFKALMPDNYAEEIAQSFVPTDMIGINYYFPGCSVYDKNEIERSKRVENYYVQEGQYFEQYPAGLYDTLAFVKERYGNPEVYITENGLGQRDTGLKEDMLNDDDRIFYMREHLRMISRGIKAGFNVKGYYYWSNFDSFENAAGHTYRFGLNYVDFATGERTRKKSWYYYQKIIADGCVD